MTISKAEIELILVLNQDQLSRGQVMVGKMLVVVDEVRGSVSLSWRNNDLFVKVI